MKRLLPLSPALEARIYRARETVRRILDRRDPRLFVVVGPCSIHSVEAATDYARRLHALSRDLRDALFIVMRVYFVKARTSIGWKGFIYDPHLDDSFHVEEGLRRARELLLTLAEMGLPVATEAVDAVTPQYIGDLITWTAIGARTTESQTHREMASGLSTPVGFKNATDGNMDAAINALRSAVQPHHFLGITSQGQSAVFHTRGNRYGHVVLRGGARSNYDRTSVARCEAKLRSAGLPVNIMIDCSHRNSNGNPARQPRVLECGLRQMLDGNRSIIGFMIESYLRGGRQDIARDPSQVASDVSVTDACVDWPTTERMLRRAGEKFRNVLSRRRKS
jgi:3-deoxy-7-phosphoheptulonate synthase